MDSKWERVIPYIELNEEAAEKMMSPINPGEKIQKISLIKRGLRNSNYRIEYQNKKFLLRVYGVDDDWWKKEKVIYNHVSKKVRVPNLYYLGEEYSIRNKPYAIFEYVEGPTLDEYLQNENYDKNVIREIGKNLAFVHETPYNEIGFFEDSLVVTTKLPPLREWFDLFLTGNTERKLGIELSDQVRKYIEKNENNIKRIEERISFVHNDFRPINIIINDNRPYIIDWECSMAGHVFGDIGQFLRIKDQITEKTEKLFIDSYNTTIKNKLPEDYKELAKLRDLVNPLQMLNSKHDLHNKDRDLINIIEATCTESRVL